MKKNRSSKVIHFKPRSQASTKPPESSDDPERTEYEETLSAPSWLRLGSLGFFILVIGFFLLQPFLAEGTNDGMNLLLCLVFALVAWFVQIFLSMKISLTNKGIKFGFYLFSKKLDYRDILDCMVIRYKLTDFLGWGVRKGYDGCTMYNVPGDQQIAVKIVVVDGEQNRKEFAFSAKRPQVICKKIQAHLYDVPAPGEENTGKDKTRKFNNY